MTYAAGIRICILLSVCGRAQRGSVLRRKCRNDNATRSNVNRERNRHTHVYWVFLKLWYIYTIGKEVILYREIS